jgi:hypothetical protein
MDAFFSLANLFTQQPGRALGMALVFVALAVLDRWLAQRRDDVRPWVQLVPATGWMLFALNEQQAKLADMTTRFDLYLTWPVLALLTLVGAYAGQLSIRRAWHSLRERDGDAKP